MSLVPLLQNKHPWMKVPCSHQSCPLFWPRSILGWNGVHLERNVDAIGYIPMGSYIERYQNTLCNNRTSIVKASAKALIALLMKIHCERRFGPIVQPGMNAAFAMRKSRVQIPLGPLPFGFKRAPFKTYRKVADRLRLTFKWQSRFFFRLFECFFSPLVLPAFPSRLYEFLS